MMAWDGNWTEMAIACREETVWTASSGCSATATATGAWINRIATCSGPRSRRAPATPVTFGISTSTGTATWTAGTTGNSTAASASFEEVKPSVGRFEKPSYNTQRIWKKAAGEVLT